MPRKLDAILDAAVKLIDPADSAEAFRAQLTTCIDIARRHHQETANLPPPGELKTLAGAYMKALRKARKAAGAVRSFSRSDDFTTALDREILRVHMAARDCLVVRAGAPQRDAVADLAAIMARDLIDPNPYRHPENRGKDLPVIECPWRRPVTLTYGGPWLQLTGLIYEGATGESGHDTNMMKACREVDEPRPPRYVVRLPFKAPS
jgi:hypothetical protein